jgi:ElaB/YqjD/DUF883 family membrane-anchored ribosome-binding protein
MMVAKPKFIIGHFDSHGIATVASRARSLGVPPERVYAKFPVTGPEQLPNYIDTYFPTLLNYDVEIIDIPVNIRNPKQFIDIVNRLATNTSVTIYDHHKTDYQFVTQILARVIIFGSGIEMAEVLSDERNRMLAYVGVVADRDSSILTRMSRDEVERDLLPLANRLDVLVRQDAERVVKELVTTTDPVEYIKSVNTQYPPESLVRQVSIVKRGLNTVLVDLTSVPAQQISAWSWKTTEQIALIHRVDYVVAIAESFDRQTNSYVPTVMVIKYWLSNKPSPRPQLQPVLGRTTIGHDDAFSVRALDRNDAIQLAEQLFNELELLTPRTTHLINERAVANAVRADFATILTKLTQILENQSKMYQEYLELKRQQVELLKQLQDRRARAD